MLDLVSEDLRNAIEQANRERRREQMSKLIQTGLKKTEKEAKVKKGIGNAMRVVCSKRYNRLGSTGVSTSRT
jgi:hypothetical protein